MAGWWAGGFDLLLTPTLGEPPVPLGTFQDPDDPLAGIFRGGPFTPFTPAANMTGQPAISLPLHETPDGLPVGIHLVAAARAVKMLVLAVAAQLARARPRGQDGARTSMPEPLAPSVRVTTSSVAHGTNREWRGREPGPEVRHQ